MQESDTAQRSGASSQIIQSSSKDKKESMCEIDLEESLVGESKSLGSDNIQIQCIQGQVRTLRDALESRYSGRLTEESPVIPW